MSKGGFTLIVFPVRDLDSAKALYGQVLGVQPYAEGPYYVGFRVGDQEIGLDPNGHSKGRNGVVSYRQVADINATLDSLRAAGTVVQEEVSRVGSSRQIAIVKDADGNFIGLMQNG